MPCNSEFTDWLHAWAAEVEPMLTEWSRWRGVCMYEGNFPPHHPSRPCGGVSAPSLLSLRTGMEGVVLFVP